MSKPLGVIRNDWSEAPADGAAVNQVPDRVSDHDRVSGPSTLEGVRVIEAGASLALGMLYRNVCESGRFPKMGAVS